MPHTISNDALGLEIIHFFGTIALNSCSEADMSNWQWNYTSYCKSCSIVFPFRAFGPNPTCICDCPVCGKLRQGYNSVIGLQSMQRISTSKWYNPLSWFGGYYIDRNGKKYKGYKEWRV